VKGVTVIPKRPTSAALTDVPEPPDEEGPVLVEAVAVGVCGTDEEIVAGEYGWPPPGRDHLVLGHESLGRVLEAPADAALSPGDAVVGFVRHPDPDPCVNCAAGEWDMCRNGRYTEHGIKERDGFMRERYRLRAHHLVKVDPSLGDEAVLLEPTSVVTKCWDHVDRIASRAEADLHRALVTGAGPVGLLAAMIAVQRGLKTNVLDRATEGPKPELVKELGAAYHTDIDGFDHDLDVVIECTGVGELAFHALRHVAPNGIVALAGLSGSDRRYPVEADALNKEMVLENIALFGSVNAGRRHYEAAARALSQADPRWLKRIITRRVPLERWEEALTRQPDDVKVVVDIRSDPR
jgi:threonine dehydrogenase-like Zn-dependent dehydrogenase